MTWLPLWLRRLLGIARPAPDGVRTTGDSSAPKGALEPQAIEPARTRDVQRVSVSRADTPEDERALAVLGQFRDELKSHHAVQSELAGLIRELHAPMRALPELARQQGGLMETLVDQSSRSRARDSAIERSLQQLTDGAARQTQVLGLVQQQLDLNHETSMRVSDSLRDTASALGAFAATTDRQTRALEALAESTRRRLAQSERLERTLQFWLLIVSGLATLILLYALWAAMRVPPTPPARPEVVAADVDGTTRAASGGVPAATAVQSVDATAASAPTPAASANPTAASGATGAASEPAKIPQAPIAPPRPATTPSVPASTIP